MTSKNEKSFKVPDFWPAAIHGELVFSEPTTKSAVQKHLEKQYGADYTIGVDWGEGDRTAVIVMTPRGKIESVVVI